MSVPAQWTNTLTVLLALECLWYSYKVIKIQKFLIFWSEGGCNVDWTPSSLEVQWTNKQSHFRFAQKFTGQVTLREFTHHSNFTNYKRFFLSHLDKAMLCFYQCGCACDACWHAYYWQGESAQEELLAAWLSAFQMNATSVLSDDHNPNTQRYCHCVALDFTLTVHLC